MEKKLFSFITQKPIMTSKNSNNQKMSEKGTRSLFSNAFPVRIWSKPNYALVFGFNK